MRCKVTKIQSNKLFKNPAASYLVNREVLQELVQMKGFYTQKQDRTRKLLAKENKGLFQAVTFLQGKDVAGVLTGRLPHQHDQEFQTDLRSHSCVCVCLGVGGWWLLKMPLSLGLFSWEGATPPWTCRFFFLTVLMLIS